MTTATDTDLAERVRLAVTRLARRLRQQTGEGVSPTQLSALSTIERRGPITLGDLAHCERVRPPTVTAAVARLEEAELVERSVDQTDRRVTRVAMTAAGRKLLARSRSRKAAYLERRLRALSAQDRETLSAAADVLDRLLDQESRE